MSTARRLLLSGGSTPSGEEVFTSSGTWTAPAGVYLVSVVAIGQGGTGSREELNGGATIRSRGGGGGGLGWKNEISVVPEQSYTVSITSSGSYFISQGTVWGEAGGTPNPPLSTDSSGGIFVGDGGGNGGDGSSATGPVSEEFIIAGGGDAGNYNSDGANGSSLYNQTSTAVNTGDGSGLSGSDAGNYGFGGTSYVAGGSGVVQIRWGVNKDFS